MKYKFNFVFQFFYGIFGFLLALVIIYLFTKEWDWIASVIIGVSEFIISGFYTRIEKVKKEK